MSKIVVWGDSITWGSADDELGGWVNRLRRDLVNNRRSENLVYNLGIRGEKVGDVLKRFEREYRDLKPDIIILGIGINDSPHATYRKGTSLDVFERRYSELVKKMKDVSNKIIIIGPINLLSLKAGNTTAINGSLCWAFMEKSLLMSSIPKTICY